ncbi:MAG: hypothetical protein ACRCZY_08860 [Phocaeicola sp.]
MQKRRKGLKLFSHNDATKFTTSRNDAKQIKKDCFSRIKKKIHTLTMVQESNRMRNRPTERANL